MLEPDVNLFQWAGRMIDATEAGLTRYGLWDALDRPGGFYTLWCSTHWRLYEYVQLGRRTINDAAHVEFMIDHARDFDAWLWQQYRRSISVTFNADNQS